MDIMQEAVKILKEKSHKSNVWKAVLVIGLIVLGIWLFIKFARSLAPRTNRQHIRDLYIPRYPSRRRW